MDEHEQLLNPDNYKILIQLKKNRRKRLKARYLTPDFEFSENINDALIFEDFQQAENMLSKLNNVNSKPRVFIRYIDDIYEKQNTTQNSKDGI